MQKFTQTQQAALATIKDAAEDYRQSVLVSGLGSNRTQDALNVTCAAYLIGKFRGLSQEDMHAAAWEGDAEATQKFEREAEYAA